MKPLLLIVMLMGVLFCCPASAQLTATGVGGGFGTSGGGGCTNQLDYSNSCNSQYVILSFH